jgi:hypothetical protein
MLPAPLVAAALLAEPELAELEVLVESEDPPQPASAVARPNAESSASVTARAVNRRDLALINSPWWRRFSGLGAAGREAPELFGIPQLSHQDYHVY